MLTLTRSHLENLYSHLFDAALPPGFLFGVRGAVPAAPGSLTLVPRAQHLDQYDDAIGFMLDGRGHAYQGSVDPGRYYTLHPDNPGGCAHVVEGHYTFYKGPHKHEPRAWKGENVLCWRDKNRNGVQDPSEQHVFLVKTSIDLHYGGYGNTIGEYSAGCQIVHQPYWEVFRDLTYSLFGHVTTYWLIEYHMLLEAVAGQPSPSMTINGVPVARTCPVWVSDDLHVVAAVRDLLGHLNGSGHTISVEYEALPTPALLFSAGETIVPGKLVDGRLVCEVAALLRAIDPAAVIHWHADQKRVEVLSALLQAVTPSPQVLERLAEIDEDDPVVDQALSGTFCTGI